MRNSEYYKLRIAELKEDIEASGATDDKLELLKEYEQELEGINGRAAAQSNNDRPGGE